MPNTQSEVITGLMTDNQTFNTCPKCLKTWETYPPIPGIIHRTTYCKECKSQMDEEVFGHMKENKK